MVKNKRFLVLGFSIGMILIYKLWILLFYNIHYVDEDQALMWLGTVYFSHGEFPEPCFWGQNYGAMLEALFSVPLYWCGVPLSIACPLVTSLFTALPIIVMLCLTKDEGIIVLITGSFLMLGYQFDILFSVPRSFAMGISITTLACIVLLCAKRKMALFMASALAVIGIVITNTAIFPLAFTGIYLLYRDKCNVKKFILYISGGGIGVCYYLFVRYFYESHPEYMIHKGYGLEWSLINLDLSLVIDTLRELNFLESYSIGIFILLTFFGILAYYKYWDMFWFGIIGAVLSVSVFGHWKIYDVVDGVLLSMYRMLLFIPYMICLFWFFWGRQEKIGTSIKTKKYIPFCFFLIACSIIFKCGRIYNVLYNTDELTKTGGELRIVKTKETLEICEEILEEAEGKTHWIVTISDSRPEAYILASLGYGKYHFYNQHYDRREWERKAAETTTEDMCYLGVYFGEEAYEKNGEAYFLEERRIRNTSIVDDLQKGD